MTRGDQIQAWGQAASDAIRSVRDSLPPGATYEDAVKALKAAYPFESRRGYVLITWNSVRKAFLMTSFPGKHPQIRKRLPVADQVIGQPGLFDDLETE